MKMKKMYMDESVQHHLLERERGKEKPWPQQSPGVAVAYQCFLHSDRHLLQRKRKLGKVLVQTREPVSNPQNPHRKLEWWQSQGGRLCSSWSLLASQHDLLIECQANETYCLKNQGRELLKNGHLRLTSDLHRHACAYTDTLKIKMKRSQLRLKAVQSIQKRARAQICDKQQQL